jgi:NAD(P)H-hydrate epimerase
LQLFNAAIGSGLPLVVDADALNLMARHPGKYEHWILTPHPGEAARLLDCSVEQIQRDRFTAIDSLQQRYGGTVVLKGSGTIIKSPAECPAICSLGNPGMASGGMGDVLTGVIAALIAQGLILDEAAKTGVSLHAAAGDAAANQGGERGLLASDLMPHLRALMNT